MSATNSTPPPEQVAWDILADSAPSMSRAKRAKPKRHLRYSYVSDRKRKLTIRAKATQREAKHRGRLLDEEQS